MNQQVKRIVERATAAFGVLGLGTALTVVSLLSPAASIVNASASGGQVASRSVKLSSSTPSATGQSYDVKFTAASSATVQGIVVDFCSGAGTPIVGDSSCAAPTGMSLSGVTLTDNPDSVGANLATVSGWTVATLNSGRSFEIKNATGVATTANTSIFNFAIVGVQNPSTTGTFYARVITYTTTAAADAYLAGTEGTYQDYGGFALSTATNINITAKVQETLTFCTSGPTTAGGVLDPMDGANGGSDCTAATAPNLTIGHGTPVATLNNGQIDAAYAFTQLSTNATSGAIVRMHATNACANGGLSTDGGTNCAIPGIGNTTGGGAQAISTAVPNTGNAAYGLFVSTSRTTTGASASTGTVAPNTDYNDGTHVTEGVTPALTDMRYGMVTDATGVTSTYGSVIASSTGPLNTINNDLVFAAIASLTTPAGIYQGAESLIATGTF